MVAVAAALLIFIAWCTVAAVLVQKHRDAIAAELRQNSNLARALTEQTVRVLATADQATVRVRDAVLAGKDTAPELARYASETGLAPAILVQLSLIDAQGRFAASNLDPDGSKTGHVDLSTREHVRAHLKAESLPAAERPARPDDLFIGKAVIGKVSKKWTIQLSRRIADADGHLLGVVVASLDPVYFEDVFRRVALGSQGGVTLVGTDLGIRARVIGGNSVGMGGKLGANGLMSRPDLDNEGTFEVASTVDGVQRIGAYQRVAGYPIYLQVNSGKDEALEPWRASRNVALVLTLLLSASMAGGALLMVLGLKRIEATLDALRVSESQANSANQAKSEFLAAISHELRTPLTSIRGFAELMERRLEDPRFRESAALIRKGAEHLNELLTQILDMAKVESGAMPLNNEPVPLRPLLQGTLDFFALTAADKGLALKLSVPDTTPESLDCDGLRLKQILNNLLSNAIKFTPAGRVDVEVEAAAGELRFQVRDTGPGIAPEVQQIIFEKFRQGNDRVSYEHGGTGLGLSLSRSLAELMKGRLTVESVPGQGACFTLALPCA
jgi:signal transduction histidine kinase